MDVRVRVGGRADLDDVVRLFGEYLEFYGCPRDPGDVRAFLDARLHDGGSVVLVAVTGDGPVVGFAQCYPTWSSLSLAPAWVLNDLYVDPAARGTGAGRALVRGALAAARAAGAVSVSLETAVTNARAQALYESEGFVREEEFWTYAVPV